MANSCDSKISNFGGNFIPQIDSFSAIFAETNFCENQLKLAEFAKFSSREI